MAYEMIEVRTEADKVGIITLNRPKQLNALNDQLMDELGRRSRPLTPTRPSAA
jgi:enoyl-CoA hydratase